MARGGASEDAIMTGSMVGLGLAICFCTIGIPVIITGIIMMLVTSSGTTVWVVGLVLLLVALITLIVGIAIIIGLCTGCGKRERTQVHPQNMFIQPINHIHMPPSYQTATTEDPAYPQPGRSNRNMGASSIDRGYPSAGPSSMNMDHFDSHPSAPHYNSYPEKPPDYVP